MQNAVLAGFSSESWVILSSIEKSIKEKIEKIGTPLKDWDIQINYGIKTGFNDAFIIDSKKREELITADPKSEEIIRPLLRGRDIKRYSYEFADLYIIATFPSLKIDIEQYPAVKEHLMSFGIDRLQQTGEPGARKKTNNKWFETQDSIGYWEEFNRQKIVWKAVGKNLAFSLLEEGSFITAPASFITSDYNLYLLGFLCSSCGKYYILNNSDTTGAGDVMLNIQSLSKFPIPKVSGSEYEELVEIVKHIIDLQKKNNNISSLQIKLDNHIYKLYGFIQSEIKEIEK